MSHCYTNAGYITPRPYLSYFVESLKRARKQNVINYLTNKHHISSTYPKGINTHLFVPEGTKVSRISLLYNNEQRIKMGYATYNDYFTCVFTLINNELIGIPVFDLEKFLKDIIIKKYMINYTKDIEIEGDFIIEQGTIKVL